MSTRVETSGNDGVVLAWTNREHNDSYEVQMWLGHDGVTVVQIDVPPGVGRVRVNLNEGAIWDGDPDTDEAPGEYGKK